ncbi:aspartic peptidase domain-containing protein [Triangularia verruculosa]|uniref:Aspartic peptidase domain-containing protein n=1 Tax=Triangularia verruculosa TaxID=2587418 RepID=A0AAN6XIY6_9PEZI|nr:aspartic peptidase domain-containing protein [Triangularia verruculosa]
MVSPSYFSNTTTLGLQQLLLLSLVTTNYTQHSLNHPNQHNQHIMEPIFLAQSKLRAELGLHKVKAIPNSNFQRHGTKAYASAINRYGIQPTKPGPLTSRTIRDPSTNWTSGKFAAESLRKMWNSLVEKTGDDKPGEVGAQDQQGDMEYLCEVLIGTPPQKVLLDFDTGSADLWVRPDAFKHDESSSFELLKHKDWKIQYGDGSSASGFVGNDTISIGGLVIKKQAVEVAKHVSAQFSQGVMGGLLGLAFKQINTVHSITGRDPQPTPVDNMIAEEDIPKEAELFTSAFYSSRDLQPESFYTFGWIDQDLVEKSGEEIAWAKVDSTEGFWLFDSASASIDGEKVELSGNKAIADTGTTLALISDQACDALYKKIDGAAYSEQYQGYLIPKSAKVDDLPELSVAVGEKEFVIQKEDLIFADADDSNYYGGVQSRGSMPFDILGDTFLKSIYAIWDQGNSRFGAVPKIEKTQKAPLPSKDGDGAQKVICLLDKTEVKPACNSGSTGSAFVCPSEGHGC